MVIQINWVVVGGGGERQENDGKIPLESKVKEKKPDLSWNRKVSARPPRDLGLKGMWVRHRQMLSLRSTSPSCKKSSTALDTVA